MASSLQSRRYDENHEEDDPPPDFLAECESFTSDDTHPHDDQVDPMIDAINEMLGQQNKLSVWERMI
jgi:hypothetical protein